MGPTGVGLQLRYPRVESFLLRTALHIHEPMLARRDFAPAMAGTPHVGRVDSDHEPTSRCPTTRPKSTYLSCPDHHDNNGHGFLTVGILDERIGCHYSIPRRPSLPRAGSCQSGPRAHRAGQHANDSSHLDCRQRTTSDMFNSTFGRSANQNCACEAAIVTMAYDPPIAIETEILSGGLVFRQHSAGHTPNPNWPYFLTFANASSKLQHTK